ncbi:MAG TPA: site-specific integrase, partial [Bryobacteraceae bacterium]|nr:site-specific integrase [Bryobacteraceae bacterium]
TPKHERHCEVFPLMPVEAPGRKGGHPRAIPGTQDATWVGTICRRIGKKAGVIVDTTDKGRIKYASAHDLRRAFGTRWARRVKTPVLMQLMRHKDIKTTMRYYVELDAEETASEIWEAVRRLGGIAQDCSVSCSADESSAKTKEIASNVS